jgi:hypothetical protein
MPESALGLGLLADDLAEYIDAAFEKKAELVAWGYILRNTGPRQQFPVISLPYFAGLSVSSKSSALGHADRGTMPDGQSSKNWTFRRWR